MIRAGGVCVCVCMTPKVKIYSFPRSAKWFFFAFLFLFLFLSWSLYGYPVMMLLPFVYRALEIWNLSNTLFAAFTHVTEQKKFTLVLLVGKKKKTIPRSKLFDNVFPSGE